MASKDEDEKLEQWLDDQLTGKYATGELETDLRMAVSTIRDMSKMTPKDFAVQPLMRFIHQRESQAELRGQKNELLYLLNNHDAENSFGYFITDRLDSLTAPTTNDTATDGGES